MNVNGFTCKDAKDVVAEDFFFSGLHVAANSCEELNSGLSQVADLVAPKRRVVEAVASLAARGSMLGRGEAPRGSRPGRRPSRRLRPSRSV